MQLTRQQLAEDLFAAYSDARRNKRNTRNQLRFEVGLEANIMALARSLEERSWTPGRSVAFIINYPVKREVFAASFADRVIHHLFYNYTNEIFERQFIADSYSCRKGRGTGYGIDRLDHHIRSCSHNYTRDAWILKLDLSGYFMSIDRQTLYEKVSRSLLRSAGRKNSAGVRFGDALDYDMILYLAREICLYDPLQDCFIKGRPEEWSGLPADKSLFGTAEGSGLPIGNLTSQLFSNVYLNEFDHWVKRELKVVHYGRYVDDFYLVDTSRDFLLDAKGRITDYLRDNLGIRVHPKKVYSQHVSHGVTFLGAVVKPHRRYTTRRALGNFKQAMARGERHYRYRIVELSSMLNSYLGLIFHYRTFDLRRRILDKHPWIYRFGRRDVDYRRFRLDS